MIDHCKRFVRILVGDEVSRHTLSITGALAEDCTCSLLSPCFWCHTGRL